MNIAYHLNAAGLEPARFVEILQASKAFLVFGENHYVCNAINKVDFPKHEKALAELVINDMLQGFTYTGWLVRFMGMQGIEEETIEQHLQRRREWIDSMIQELSPKMKCMFKRCNGDEVVHCDGACHGKNPDGTPLEKLPDLAEHIDESVCLACQGVRPCHTSPFCVALELGHTWK